MELGNWKGVPRPARVCLEGQYARLEPLHPAHHGASLLASRLAPGAEARFRYLFDPAPRDSSEFAAWLQKAADSADPLFFAVIDKLTDRAEGRQALMRIDTTHGVIEIGSILWGPAIARTRVATESLLLFAAYVFDRLGYRRLEWKCDNRNEPSKRAAERFGFSFEGVFRQHMVVKGRNRDTAWFAITDGDWPRLKRGFEAWLRPENFDAIGLQKTRLTF